MISHELAQIWITSDGKRFLTKDEAVKHEDTLADPKDLVSQWLEKLKGEKFDVYVHTTNIVLTGLDTGDKWRINKLEGKKATAARAEDKPKTETKVETKDTKNVTKTKTKYAKE